MTRVLLLGNGGREHALALAIARSPRAPQLWCAPGNAGTAEVARNVDLKLDDLDGIVAFAEREAIDLTMVGPEAPLVAGLVDRFREKGLRIFGPGSDGARLEGSKAHAKEFMGRHGIPTAPFAIARTAAEGREAIARLWTDHGVVVKADGLAAGKGVVVASTRGEAEATVLAWMEGRELGTAGDRLVIEERLTGPEASCIVLLDANGCRRFPLVQDHKRLLEGDRGPNTGGMGTYFPLPLETDELTARIEAEILQPVMRGLREEGVTYRGALFIGLMLTQSGPQVLEFNCRFGDPETQVLMAALQSDALDLFDACVEDRLNEVPLVMAPGARLCVVAAREGYPAATPGRLPVTGVDEASEVEGVTVLHAGCARMAEGTLMTSGGRVLNVVAEGRDIEEARTRAYRAVERLRFGDRLPVYRRDLGAHAQEALR